MQRTLDSARRNTDAPDLALVQCLFHDNPNCMWVYDRESLALLDVNEAALTRYGYAREEFLAMTILDLLPPDQHERLRRSVREVPGRLRRVGVWPQICRDGAVLEGEVTTTDVLYGGRPARLVLVNDVTEQVRMQHALRLTEDRLSETLRLTGLGFWHRVMATGESRWSEELFDMLGLPGDRRVASFETLLQAVHPEDRERVRATLDAALADGGVYENTYRVVTPEGVRVLHDLARIERDADGRAVRIFGTRQDITERVAAEEEIRRLNAELEERVQQRTAELEAANRELEAFSYSVSHDLRAPLRAIDGFSRIVMDEAGPVLSESCREYLHLIRDNTRHMGQLIDDLLTFSRLSRQGLQMGEVDMGRLARQCYEELAPDRQGRKIEFTVATLPIAFGDRNLLKQVWANLLSNAIKYTRTQAAARIEVGAAEVAGGYGASPVYFVRDNGVGFDMQYAHKLFGVFQRLHLADEYEGTGVGLAIVQRVVHRHAGRVWAEAAPGAGATFYFTVGAQP